MKQFRLLLLSVFSMLALMIFSCSEETTKVDLPTSAVIHFSVVDKQVAFTALTHSADTWLWDFGDGETSTEKNPVHIYADGGFYTATLSVTGSTGTDDDAVELALALTPYVLLTGGPTAANGKTWKLSASHSGNGDYLAWADADLNPFDPDITPLPDGAFGLFLGMGEVYDDEFTFHFDGSYKVNVKAGAAFAGVFYALSTGGIQNGGGLDFGLVTTPYTPETDATFTWDEGVDFTNPSVFGAVTYPGVTIMDFSGTAYAGFLDFQRKVIVQNVTVESMQIVIFASLDPDAAGAGLSTNALILTFEVVS